MSQINHLEIILTNYVTGEGTRERIGWKIEQKPKGYWKKWENVESELEEAIEENNGEFPTHRLLKKTGKSSLSMAICKYHKGFNVAMTRMGFDSSRKPNGYWKKWENVEAELKQAIEDNDGEFPTQIRLYEMGRSSLNYAIRTINHHNGVDMVRKRMGFSFGNKKPNGYWKKWENVERELEEAIEENNGEFPTQTRLYEMGKSSLVTAITRDYMGLEKVRERMGFDSGRKPKGYWKKWENVERELEEVMEQEGEIPTQKRLRDLGKSSLGVAITKYHGGINSVRERMGFGENDNINHLEIILKGYVEGMVKVEGGVN